jgi:hypothetical protein
MKTIDAGRSAFDAALTSDARFTLSQNIKTPSGKRSEALTAKALAAVEKEHGPEQREAAEKYLKG